MVKKQSKTAGLPRWGDIKIGEIIRDELRRQKRTVTWFSGMLNCDRRNVYDIFLRESIDTQLLFRICLTLGVDFFAIYSQTLKEEESDR